MRNILAGTAAANVRVLLKLLTVCAAAVLSGCTSGSGSTPSTPISGTSKTAPDTVATSIARQPGQRPHARHRRRPPASSSHGSGSLSYSTAGNDVVHTQPAPGSCHAIGSGPNSRPDPACTPGALNPAVRQATIDRTICAGGWTATVRPPEGVTEQEKVASMAAYGDTAPIGSYEYDHFVPLELGGATNDPRNLWPEPGASPNPKDAVENELRREVCDGRLSLAAAQREIVTNWVSLARRSSPPSPPSPPSPGRPSAGSSHAPGAQCTLTAAYSPRYHDYDVYVHSNQPDQTVTVTDADGHSDSWHTDGSGYADVYFKSGGYAPGRRVTARVGQATCSTDL